MAEGPRCGYCGRFMATVDPDGWDCEPRCSLTDQHILDDPAHWSVYVTNFDIGDGTTWTGPYPADMLTTEQLRAVLEARPA